MEKNYLIDSAVLGGIVDGILNLNDFDEYESKKADVRKWAIDRLDSNVGLAVFANLTEEQRAVFDKKIEEKASEEELSAFFNEAGISLEKIIQKEIVNIKDEILEKMREE